MTSFIRYYAAVGLGLLAGAILTGCATPPTSDEDFGKSVNRMIEAQKYTPPGQEKPGMPKLDGAKAEGAIEGYRQQKAEPERIYKNTTQPVQLYQQQ